VQVASQCSEGLDLPMPFLIDDMTNGAERAYDCWPDRLFLIDEDGTIAWKSGHGPWGFDVAALERELKAPQEEALRQDAPRK
jgi:hypothetical protein